MTYRERRLAKAERLRGWADKRESKSAAAFRQVQTIADGIPFGQPILVGHHSEKHHRADIARIDGGIRRGIEHADKAREMQSKADNIEAAAERAIYSDDPDAIEALTAKLEGLEAERERVKVINKAIRKHGLARLLEDRKAAAALRHLEGATVYLVGSRIDDATRDALALLAAAREGLEATTPAAVLVPLLSNDEGRELASVIQHQPYYNAETRGFPPYHSTNLGGNITRARQRLEALKRDQGNRDQWQELTGARERVALVWFLIEQGERVASIPEWSYNADADKWSRDDGARAFQVSERGEADHCFAELEARGYPRRAVLFTMGQGRG